MICSVHRRHQDAPEVMEHHHVLPVSWYPASTATIVVCPSGHSDIHSYIDLLVRSKGVEPAWKIRRRYNKATRAFAVLAYTKALSLGLKPKLTL